MIQLSQLKNHQIPTQNDIDEINTNKERRYHIPLKKQNTYETNYH